MRYLFVLSAIASLAMTGGSAFAAPVKAPAQAPQCVTSGLPTGVQRAIGNKVVFVRPIATVLDAAIDDFGQSAGSDNLQMFCVTNKANDVFGTTAICLSGESCPWR